MRRILKILGLVVAALVVLVGGFLLYVQIDGIPRYPVEKVTFRADPTPERIARGKKLASMLCAGCHADPTTQRLTGKHMADAPEEFGYLYAPNITKHPTRGIGTWTDSELAYLLRTGVKRDGQYTPPYMAKLTHMSDEDLASIIAFLRSDDPMVEASDQVAPRTRPSLLTKVLSHTVFRKLPYPDKPITAPPLSDRVAYGRYLVFGLECYPCHSADFKTMNVAEPEKSAGYMGGGNILLDLQRKPIRSANLTSDAETGIGRWSERDFVAALHGGFRPDRTPIRYPMAPIPELSDEEAGAIYAYLRTVSPIRNAFERNLPPPPAPPTASAAASPSADGKRLYERYGCVGCHGQDGVGIADLRKANEHYPTRAALKAWIRDAQDIKPGTKMPSWKNVIPEADYDPLIDHVLQLCNHKS